MPDILIYGIIGESVTAASVAEQLEAAAGADVRVKINSQGGSFTEGVAIHNLLKDYAGPVTTYNEGLAGSAGGIVLMAGDRREMAENALFMLHGNQLGTEGGLKEHEDAVSLLKAGNEAMVPVYVNATGKTPDEVSELMSRNTWMAAREAVAEGFATDIVEPSQLAASISFTSGQPGTSVNHPGEVTMTDTNTPKAATIQELSAAFPKAPDQFVLEQLKAEAPIEEAKNAYISAMEEKMEEMQARLTAMEEEHAEKMTAMEGEKDEAVKAMGEKEKELEAVVKARGGVVPVAMGSKGPASSAGNAAAEWNKELTALKASGMGPQAAVKQLAESKPELWDQYVEEANQNRRQTA